MEGLTGMTRILLAAAAFALVLSACGSPETPAEAPEVEAAAKEVTTGIEATAFLTENTPAPEGAADTKDDGVLRDAEGRPFQYALLGQKLPAFTAPMADGSTFDSASLNRWTVIDVWGAWCSDCIADGPYVAALERAIAQDPDLDFLSIHVPASAARATPEEMFGKFGSLDAYFESAGYVLPVVLDLDGSLRKTLQISWTPSYLLVSPDGVVRGFRTDLSIVDDQPIKSFIQDIARVRGEVRETEAFVMGPDGVAGLNSAMPFKLQALERAFPGFEVVPGPVSEESAGTFIVRRPGSTQERLRIEPDWTRGFVGAVSSRATGVKDTSGHAIGTATLTSLPLEEQALCDEVRPAPGGTEFACADSDAPTRFTRIFRYDPANPGAEAVAEDVSGSVLVELRYTPPPAGR